MLIKQITDYDEKKRSIRFVLEALPDWFAVEESREEYINDSVDRPTFVAYDDDGGTSKTAGFLCLKQTGKETVELAVMGVLKEYHRHGIGRQLFDMAKAYAVEKGYDFMQVKTVKMGMYDDYDATNRFYQALGFKEFEVFPMLWDEANPCQIYVMGLK